MFLIILHQYHYLSSYISKHLILINCFDCQLDCGIHPGMSGMEALPYTDIIDPEEIDLLLVSQ